jgi:hypothetical protein
MFGHSARFRRKLQKFRVTLVIKERIRLYQAIKKGDYELAHSWRAKNLRMTP